MRGHRTRQFCVFAALACMALMAQPVKADKFTYRGQDGASVEVEARLVGSGQGFHALELADGQYRVIPEGAVEKREPGDGPTPLDAAGMIAKLEKQFGEELFRAEVLDPYVMGLVLGSPLPKAAESRATNFLKRAAKFMKNVDGAFIGFIKEARIPAKPPTHPLVVLIFETQTDFNTYTTQITGGRGLSAGRISGFYSGMTNFLAIRLGECRTFDVPLHEAIHQQVYNRNVFARLAPVPHWFDEGIATGFEANQGKISIGPTKISTRYAGQALAARELSCEKLLTDDSVFAGDVLAGEAYGYAWGLHWLLVTKYKSQYGKYVRTLAEKEPLQKESPEQRLSDFRDAFGKGISEVEKEFRPALDAGVKRQKVTLNAAKPAGISLTHENMAEVELTAVRRLDQGGRLEVEGKLTNISPLRALSFHVTVETDSGSYADWLISDLDISKSSPLKTQYVQKQMQNAGRGGSGQTFRVRVKSAPASSEEAALWKKGSLPVPVFGE